jgi:haloalkane dehalogenase
MRLLRTPESRFDNLPDFAFTPHYCEIRDADGTGLRVCTIDEGPRSGEPVLLLHRIVA